MYGISALNRNRKETPTVRQIAAKGMKGDDTVAHLTSGEVIIPKSAQSPGLMALYAKEMRSRGMKPQTYQVGSPEADKRRNPFTGAQQFWGEGEQGSPGASGNEANSGVSGDTGNNDRDSGGSWGEGFDQNGNPVAGGGGVGSPGDFGGQPNAGFGRGDIDGADISGWYGDFADQNTSTLEQIGNFLGSMLPGVDRVVSNDPKTGMMRESVDFDAGQAIGEVFGGAALGPLGGMLGGYIGDRITDDTKKDVFGGSISRDKERGFLSSTGDIFSGMFDSAKMGLAFDPGAGPAYAGPGSDDGGAQNFQPTTNPTGLSPITTDTPVTSVPTTGPSPTQLPYIDYERYGQSNRRDGRVGEEYMYPYIINGQVYYGQYPYEFLKGEEKA